jgi:hypothetical protein
VMYDKMASVLSMLCTVNGYYEFDKLLKVKGSVLVIVACVVHGVCGAMFIGERSLR